MNQIKYFMYKIGGFLRKEWGEITSDFRETGQWTELYIRGIESIWRPPISIGKD